MNRFRLSMFMLSFALIGVVTLLVSSAQTPRPYAVVEPENGSHSGTGTARVVADSTASGGKYLRYEATVAVAPPVEEPVEPQNPSTNNERPTRANTGPRYAMTDMTPVQFFSARTCNRQRITGDLNFDQSWMKGQTFTLTDCEITGRVYVYINAGGVTLPLIDMPTINMDYVDVNNGMITFNASKFTANHTYINNGAQWGLKDVWAPFISEDAPYNLINSVIYTPYLTQPFHTEALHTGDYGIGYQFTNVSFEQQGGVLNNSGVTATINFHGVNSVFDGCWFIFDGDVPAYYSAYLDAQNTTVKNSWFERGAGGYVYPSSTYKPAFENSRDFNSGDLINPL